MSTSSAKKEKSTVPAGRHALNQITYSTPFGNGLLVWRDGLLWLHRLPDWRRRQLSGASTKQLHDGQAAVSSYLINLLQQYFSGHKVTFDVFSLPLDNLGWSEFDFSVAKALAVVPYGETCSYSELAEAAGYPRAQRAVGNFLARNPFPIILPCHRIIKSNGRLGNFSSGINWKKRLLGLEQTTLSSPGRP